MLQIFEESGAGNLVKEKLRPLTDSLKKIKDFFD